MVARNPARYLAPIALVGVIVGTYLIVEHNLHPGSSTPAPAQTIGDAKPKSEKVSRAKFYTVRAGDSMSTISVKTGVPLPTLEALNQTIDPNSLQTGQRLRLRR